MVKSAEMRTKCNWEELLDAACFCFSMVDILSTFPPDNLLLIDEILVFFHRSSFSTSGHLPFNVSFTS